VPDWKENRDGPIADGRASGGHGGNPDDATRSWARGRLRRQSLVEGARSVRDDRTLDPRAGATFRFLAENDGLLIQDDAATHEYAPPRELRERYGMRAQMLGPIKGDGQLIGIVSVHHGPGPRKWRDADIAALEHAVAQAAVIVAAPA